MYRLVLSALLLVSFSAAAKNRGGDFDACAKRRSEITKQASDYHGDDQIKRLIEADLTRAKREVAEGDADECLEALDHATKLLAGQY